MPEESIKTIVVDNEDIRQFLSANFPNWDTQKAIPTLQDLWDSRADNSVSGESKIIFITDELYESNPGLFAGTVATLAPHALLIVASWNPSLIGVIEEKVAAFRAKKNLAYGKIYWIQPNVAVAQIEEAILEYEYRQAHPEAVISQEPDTGPVVISEEAKGSVDTTHNGVVITVTSSKGGSGKSTVASLLAAQIAKSSQKAADQGAMTRPLKVCLIDLDVFDGQLGFLLGKTKPTALNIALSTDLFGPELIHNNLIYSDRMGFHALLAPMRGITAMHTDFQFYSKVINILRTMFDVIILDTSVQYYDNLIKRVALPAADVVLFVTTLDIKSISGMSRWINAAKTPENKGGHGINMKKVGIVVNQSSNNVSMDEEKLATAANDVPLLVAIPLDTVAVQAAGNNNRLENIIEAHPPIGSAYFSLARKLTSKIDMGVEVNLLPLIDDEGIYASRPKSPRPEQPGSRGKTIAAPPKKTTGNGWFNKKK